MSDMSGDRPEDRTDGEHEVDLDITAFLPEGTELEPAPEGPTAAVDPGEARLTDPEAGLEQPAESAAPAPAEELDTTILEQIEAELADVENALAAIDAGEPERSPLLRELIGEN